MQKLRQPLVPKMPGNLKPLTPELAEKPPLMVPLGLKELMPILVLRLC